LRSGPTSRDMCRNSVYRRVLLGACFSQWLGQKGIRLRDVSSKHPTWYLRYRARQVRISRGDEAALRQFIAFLRRSEHIPDEKTSRRTDLPLPADVGKAIAAYMRHGRPPSTSRRLFLRARAPVRGFLSQCAIGSVVKHRLQRAGIVAPSKGAHQFRHALATGMLRKGASLAEIGEVLGHRSPDTTRIYAKVDLDRLRTVALPWPGGER
jgi:site-specific recombinase XerD